MNKQIRHKEEKRERILETALELFVKKGYHQTKIVDIALAMVMSVGLLFHYFKSKEVFYETLIEIGCANYKTVFNWQESTPLRSLDEMVNILLKAHKEKKLSASIFVFIEQSRHQKFESKKIADLFRKFNIVKNSVPYIEEGQRIGEIKEGTPLALSMLFWKALQGVVVELTFNPNAPCPSKEWIIDILRNNVK